MDPHWKYFPLWVQFTMDEHFLGYCSLWTNIGRTLEVLPMFRTDCYRRTLEVQDHHMSGMGPGSTDCCTYSSLWTNIFLGTVHYGRTLDEHW
jgi:hypothetical protein